MSTILRWTFFGAGAGLIVALISLLAWGLSSRQPVTSLSGFTRLQQPAPDFTLPLFGGGDLVLSELDGRPVVINFWSSSCPPCRDEARVLERAWRGRKDQDVVFIGTNIQDSDVAAMEFLKKFKVSYPNGPDREGRITIDYGVVGMPVTFFVDRDGVVAKRWVGAISEERLLAWVDVLITGKEASGEIDGGDPDTFYTFDELP